MAILTKPSFATRAALAYISAGGLAVVWCGIWYWYLRSHSPADDYVWYLCVGGFLTGLGR